MNSDSWMVVIPAYNAAERIGHVIAGVTSHIETERVLVVDDGSTDATAYSAGRAGVQVVQRTSNGGKGRALRDGFTQALGRNTSWILYLDADGQHDPRAIPDFQKAAATDHYDLIIGNRLNDLAEMPRSRRFSNILSSKLLSLRTGWNLFDVQCGYRAIRTGLLRRMNLQARGYDIEVELILQAWRLGGRIGWVPIPTLYRGEPSFMRKIPETLRFLKVLARSFYDQE